MIDFADRMGRFQVLTALTTSNIVTKMENAGGMQAQIDVIVIIRER